MQWQRGDKYYMHCREYKISKSYVRGKVAYSAWFRRELLGVFKTFADAELVVEQHDAGMFPHGGIVYESATV